MNSGLQGGDDAEIGGDTPSPATAAMTMSGKTSTITGAGVIGGVLADDRQSLSEAKTRTPRVIDLHKEKGKPGAAFARR